MYKTALEHTILTCFSLAVTRRGILNPPSLKKRTGTGTWKGRKN